MKRLTCRAVVAGVLAGSMGIVGLGPWFAPLGATGQEPAKPASPARSVAPSARSQPPGEPDDDDEASFREAMVHKSFQDNCLICHTEDLIAGQRLTPVQWKAEIDKMVNWGSPLPKEAAAPLLDYLARHYSDQSAPLVPTRATLEDVGSLEVPVTGQQPVPAGVDPMHGAHLYAANCATCHGPTALGGDLGPSLASKAILDHPREYNQIVRQGLRRMPGFQAVLKLKDQADVLAWLRSRTYPE
jgi:mono/diheme cytochrome c family protein